MEGDLKTLISIFISESLEYNQDAENMDTIALLVRYMTENLKENYDLIKNKQPFKIYFGIRPEDIQHHEYIESKTRVSLKYPVLVSLTELLGHEYYAHFNFSNNEMIAKIPSRVKLNADEQIEIVFNKDSIHLFDIVSKERIN